MSKPLLDKLELKVVMYWAMVLSEGCVAKCRCAKVAEILRTGLDKTKRRRLLKTAPDWVRAAWPQFFLPRGSHAKVSDRD